METSPLNDTKVEDTPSTGNRHLDKRRREPLRPGQTHPSGLEASIDQHFLEHAARLKDYGKRHHASRVLLAIRMFPFFSGGPSEASANAYQPRLHMTGGGEISECCYIDLKGTRESLRCGLQWT
jgi:hypothetical protein